MKRYAFGSVKAEDGCLIVTIDRPASLNALNLEHHQELSEIWREYERDRALNVAVLTGTGERAFCAGYDLKSSSKTPGSYFFELDGRDGFGGLTLRDGLVKPVIAAVNGLAIGGGMAMALSCDLILAAEHAEFGMPEPTMSIPSTFGGLERLCRDVPMKQALKLILLCERIGSEEALRAGMISAIVPKADLLATALEWAKKIADCAPLAVQANLAAARSSRDVSLATACRNVSPQIQQLWASMDFRSGEGPIAFSEKRKPVWTGE